MATNNPAFISASQRIMRALGVQVTVQAGINPPFAVTAVVEDGQAKVGQHGQIIGRLTTVQFFRTDYLPVRGDLITIDGVTRKVEAIDSDDGIIVVVVLHG